MERFSSAFWKTRCCFFPCCLSLYPSAKVKKKTTDFLTWEKRDTWMGGGDVPTTIRTKMWKFNLLSSSDVCLVFTPFPALLRQGYIGHRDDLSPFFSLNNSYLSLCIACRSPDHAEASSSTSVSLQQPHCCSATGWSFFFLSPDPGNLIWMDILAQLSGSVSICEHPHHLMATIVHAPSALICGSDPAEHMPHRRCVLTDP